MYERVSLIKAMDSGFHQNDASEKIVGKSYVYIVIQGHTTPKNVIAKG